MACIATQGHGSIWTWADAEDLPQPGSMLMSMACVTTKGHIMLELYVPPVAMLVTEGHEDLSGLDCHLGPYWCPGPGYSQGPCLDL